MENIIAFLIISACSLMIFFASDFLYIRLKVSSEYTRKLSHVLSGILACSLPIYFDSHWWVLAICTSFLVLLYLSIKFNFLRGINSVERKTYGSILYPIAIYICFVLNELLRSNPSEMRLYWTAILIMAISYPLAALIGKNFPIYRFKTVAFGKSIGGSLAFFILAFFIAYPLLPYENKFVFAFILSFSVTLVELLSSKGFDNILVPLFCFLLFLIFQ